MTKKKLLFVNNNMNIGGVQKSLCNLLKEISEDYDITLFLFSATGEYMNELPQNIKIVKCSGIYKYFGISQGECKTATHRIVRGCLAALTRIVRRDSVIKIMNVFQKAQKDVYDFSISFLQNGGKKSFYGGCNDFVLYKTKAKQKVTFLHCDYGLCGANYKVNNAKYKKFDKIAACSEGCKKAFVRCVDIDPKKVFTVNNCNDYERIKNLAESNPVEYDKNAVNIVSVARLSHEKGIERGIKAVHHAVNNGINIKYHLVGDGPQRNTLKELCNDLKISENVIFYGNSDNPYRYMKNADLLLIPSYHEAAPLVIDEARCLGLPILSTETTSSWDMIVNTDSGWVCKNNQEDLINLICNTASKKESLSQKKHQMQQRESNNENALQNFYCMLNR